jgi:hypothetical protein
MHSNFYEVRISKIDSVVTRAPPGMQNIDFPAGRVGGFGVHGSTGGATGAGFGLLYLDQRSHTRRTFGFRSCSGSPCRYCFSFAGLPLQQTAEGKKPLTRQTLALLQ